MVEVKLTKEQAKRLMKALRDTKEFDFSWEVQQGYDEVKNSVLAYLAGYLCEDKIPFVCVYHAAVALCNELMWAQREDEKIGL